MNIVVCAILVVASSGATLRGKPAAQAVTKPLAAKESKQTVEQKKATSKAVVAEPKGTKAAVPQKAAVVAKTIVAAVVAPLKAKVTVPTVATAKNEAETLTALGNGLQTIHNLRALFAKDKAGPKDGAEKFANGAMSEELSNKDSQVWSTIENMIGETQKAMTSIKGKSKAEKEKVMKDLEGSLDKKAGVLSKVNEETSKKQQQQDEEYLLGLLLLHKDNWSMEKQLNATEKFMHNSPILQNLFAHHDATKPLAPQLAAMLDAKPKDVVAKVEQQPAAKVAPAAATKKPVAEVASAVATKKTEKKPLGKAASAAARTMFIQLTDSYMNRDCPYCAAQCVDKCHSAGKPYVQCMTDCADAGK